MESLKKHVKVLCAFLILAMLLPGVAGAASLSNGEVKRLAGTSRVSTAITVSQEAYKGIGAETIIVSGYNGSADALTGTLLASDNNAPLLLAPNGENNLPEFTNEVRRLRARKVYILGGEATAPDFVEVKLKDMGLDVERLDGSDRFETAAIIAEKAKDKSEVFLALGKKMLDNGEEDALVDALAIGPVSAKEGIPVLLTGKDKLPKATKDAIEKFSVKKATIVGGETAITPEVKTELEGMDVTVDRISGSNRYDTATKIAKEYFTDSRNTIVASGDTDTDALVGGYLGALFDAPILLTGIGRLAKKTETYISKNSDRSYVLGGNSVVTDSVFKEIELANGVSYGRVSKDIPFKTVIEYDSAMGLGRAKAKQAGQRGKKEVEIKRIKYPDGKIVEEEVEGSEEIIKKPVEKVILVGVKEELEGEKKESISKRVSLVKEATSIVGKVPYFWGGKSKTTGWNNDWNKPKKVTVPGSSSTGKVIPFGLDCSGFVDWAYRTAGVGDVFSQGSTAGQWKNSHTISESELLPGDVGFKQDPSNPGGNHIVIYIGTDEKGERLFVHSSYSKNGIAIDSRRYLNINHFRRANNTF